VATETSAGFGAPQLFLTDARLVLAVANHLRYQALARAFGVSREQANIVTAVLLLGAADGAYETTRRLTGARLPVSGTDAAFGAVAMRDAALGIAGPSARAIPGFSTLVAVAVLGGLAAPGLRRAARRMRAVEERVRQQRIRRYSAARDRPSVPLAGDAEQTTTSGMVS
jgi:hypothetical protein